jgi:delta14-sterol reductase
MLSTNAPIQGLASVLLIYVTITLMHIIFPARSVIGYACDDKFTPLKYRLNGILVYTVCVVLFLYWFSIEYQVFLYTNFWWSLFAANLIGILTSLFFFFSGGEENYTRCITVDQRSDKGKSSLTPVSKSKLASSPMRFFLGCKWNPRFYNIDVKMLLYLLGAVQLQFNILACMKWQETAWGGARSNAMTLFCGCFGWFLVEYLLGEEVHLYTYDIFAEKIGFKLAWGCLVFYPYFYCIGAFSLAAAPPGVDISFETCVGIGSLFFLGWVLTRGANLQKYCYRKDPSSNSFLYFVKQETIPGTRILVSGWWCIARHINYFGEILQAVALALPGVLVGCTPLLRLTPLLYPLYYILLFVPRQYDDDALCREKYGMDWDEYVRRVPSRIVPGVW